MRAARCWFVCGIWVFVSRATSRVVSRVVSLAKLRLISVSISIAESRAMKDTLRPSPCSFLIAIVTDARGCQDSMEHAL